MALTGFELGTSAVIARSPCDEAIQSFYQPRSGPLDCFAPLAMTAEPAPPFSLNLELVAALQVQDLACFVGSRHLKPQSLDDLARQRHLLGIRRCHPARCGP